LGGRDERQDTYRAREFLSWSDKLPAPLLKELRGPSDDKGEHRKPLLNRREEGSHMETLKLPIFAAGALRKEQDAGALLDNSMDILGDLQRFPGTSSYRDMSAAPHMPSDKGDLKDQILSQPAIVLFEEGGQDHDIHKAVMIGDDDALGAGL